MGVKDMSIDILEELERKIKHATRLEVKDQQELLHLLTDLKREIAELSKTHQEHATSITGFTQISVHEATRQPKDQRLLSTAVEGLSTSVEGFEVSHPTLVNIVNRISSLLSNIGI
jgi:hypothetical protein